MQNATKMILSAPVCLLVRETALEPILKTENLWKIYRTGKVDVPALRGINVEIFPGEFVSIMGPSGCGKSSFLHVIGWLAKAS